MRLAILVLRFSMLDNQSSTVSVDAFRFAFSAFVMGTGPAIGNPRETSPVMDLSLYSREVKIRCSKGKFMSREGESRGGAFLHLFLVGSSLFDKSCKC